MDDIVLKRICSSDNVLDKSKRYQSCQIGAKFMVGGV